MDPHPEFAAVDHMTITVRDMEASKRFYMGILGLRVLTEATHGETTFGGFAIEDGKLVELAEEAGTALYDDRHPARHMIVFERIGGVSLSLVSFPGDNVAGAPAEKLDRLGYTHFAFDVHDLDAFMDRMRSCGVEIVGPGFIVDPDRNLIQIQESGHSDRIAELYRERFAGTV